MFYSCPSLYIQDSATLEAKITKIETIIAALEDAAIRQAAGEEIAEYTLDDGQTRIRAAARSAEDIANSILLFERILQMYANRLNGRVSRAVDQFSNYPY